MKPGPTPLPLPPVWGQPELMTDTLHRADHELKASIASALEWSPAVNSNHIGVSVTEGAVLLSGQVLTYPEKTAALRVVLTVQGVTAVADDLSVKQEFVSGPTPTSPATPPLPSQPARSCRRARSRPQSPIGGSRCRER